MFKYKELQPFYEKRAHKNLFLTQQDYFDMYVPPGINFWGGDEIGSLFFRTGQYHIVGSNNNIAIYNESKHIKLEQYKTTPTQQEVEDESISIPEVIIENRKNPSPIRYRIFISDDAEKLKFLATNLINGAPKGNEIQVYIEGDQDFLTSKKTYIRIGTRVQLDKHYLDTILNTYTNMQGNEIQALCKKLVNGNSIEENIIGNFSKNALNFELYAFAQGKAIVNKLTQNLSRLKIDFNDATFQDENGKNTAEKYIGELGRDFEIVKRHLDALDQKVLTKLQNTFLGRQLAKGVAIATNTIEAFLKILTEIAKKIAQASFSFVSFIMGFLNGLIDMLIGIIQIIALAGGAILGTSIVINGTTYALVGAERESLLEQLDHFIDSFEGINILETIDELWQNSVQFVQAIDFNAIAQFFTRQTTGNKWYSNISVYEFFYLLGYGSTFLIPTSLVARALGVFGKAGKLIGKILLAFDKVFEKVFNLALKSAKASLAWLIKLLKAIGEKLKKGTKAVTNGIKEFFEELKKALDDVFPKWRKVGLKDKEYLKILEDLKSGKLERVFKEVLSVKEEAVLKFYTTTTGYKNFNKALRGEIKMSESYLAQEKLMNDALDKLPNHSTDSLLYRIENLTEEQIKNYYKEGGTITNKHFTSSSYDISAIADSMRERSYTIMINIKNSKTGKKIEALSTLKKEKEILFRSNTKFKVERISIGTNPDTFEPIKIITLIEK